MSSLAERTGLASRIPPEQLRDLQEVALLLVDGSEVRGVLHRTPGTRTLDYLNHQAESFVALTNADVTQHGATECVAFIAINKAHIIRVIEASPDA